LLYCGYYGDLKPFDDAVVYQSVIHLKNLAPKSSPESLLYVDLKFEVDTAGVSMY